MPSTVNGIGTWYYGKKNLQVRTGLCPHCNRNAKLSSYDTRLFVVVFLIPIFPLGKKHIVEECSLCRRHGAADMKKWEESRAKAIEEGMKAMRDKPDDFRPACELYQAFLIFGPAAEADKMLAYVKEHFGNVFDVQMFLGVTLENRGRNLEANECYRQALEIDPKNPVARRAVGMVLLEEGIITDALALLDEFIQDDAKYDAGAVYALANNYKKSGKNAEAMEFFKLLHKRTPALRKDYQFKKAVRECEKAMGARKSLLAPAAWHESPWALAGLAGLVVALVLSYNFYMMYHRKIYVVNGGEYPITVAIQGGPTVSVVPGGHSIIELAEGQHTATYGGGASGTEKFNLRGDILTRMLPSETVCLNAGNAAIVLWEKTVYAMNSAIPNEYTLTFNQPLMTFHSIDHQFEAFPSSIRTKSSSETRTRVSLLQSDRQEIFGDLYSGGNANEAFNLAEWYLPMHPHANTFIKAYVTVGMRDQPERVLKFIEGRCKERPLQVEWHRARQETVRSAAGRAALVKEYDALLAGNKNDPDILYLRSRLAPTASIAMAYVSQALAINPKHQYALVSSCFHAEHRGAWDQSWTMAERAMAEMPDMVKPLYVECAYGSNHLKELEVILQAERAKTPDSLFAVMELCRLLASQGRGAEGKKIAGAYESAILQQNQNRDDGGYAKRPLAVLQYASGDFRSLDATTKTGDSLSEWRLAVYLERNDLTQLEVLIEKYNTLHPYVALLCALAFKTGGKSDLAEKWNTIALKQLENSKEEDVVVAKILSGVEAPAIDSVLDLSLSIHDEAILFAVLADRFPAQRADYLTALQRVNVMPRFPYHWLRIYASKK